MAPSSAVSGSEVEGEAGGGGGGVAALMEGAEVLLTGATGYLGKTLLEKILRSCPNVATVYLVVRPKKGLHPEQRVRDLLSLPLFSKLEGKWESKVVVLSGDLSRPGLGLSEEDLGRVAGRATLVVHSAATVRFDEPLSAAATTNVAATLHLINVARKMPNLKALIHVSTAYCNCHLKDIEEKVYPPPISYKLLLQMVQGLEKDLLESLTPRILGKWPNTYVFTKQIAEDMVVKEGKNLPIAIVRPAIVVSCINEPLPGWTDTLFGPNGIILGCGSALVRTVLCDPDAKANIVPADMVANAIISIAAATAQRYAEAPDNEKPEPLVYNYVQPNPNFDWSQFIALCKKHGEKEPPLSSCWYIKASIAKTKARFNLKSIFLHLLPALIVDIFGSLAGKSPSLVKLQKKVYSVMMTIGFFLIRDWNWKMDNMLKLCEEMSKEDKEKYPCDMRKINWNDFMKVYTAGIRYYLLGEERSSIPQAIRRQKIFFWIHYTILTLIFFGLAKVSWLLLSPLITNVIGYI